jgi:hypothetical protein
MLFSFARSAVSAVAGASLVSLAGCSSSSASNAPSGCTAQFSGNMTESVNLPANCGLLSASADAGAAGGYVLNFQMSSPEIAGLAITVDLGPSPSPGSFSSETVTDWSALGLNTGSTNCGYSAGSASVPSGSFTLDLTSVQGAVGGASGTAHGTLDLEMYVHAPPATDCGLGDNEKLEVVF